MHFHDFFKGSTDRIVIVGTNSLIPHLELSARFFADLLTLNHDLTLTIFYESDTENFNQSISLDTPSSHKRTSYSALTVHRNRICGADPDRGLLEEILGGI